MMKLRCNTACSIGDAKRCWELLGNDLEAEIKLLHDNGSIKFIDRYERKYKKL